MMHANSSFFPCRDFKLVVLGDLLIRAPLTSNSSLPISQIRTTKFDWYTYCLYHHPPSTFLKPSQKYIREPNQISKICWDMPPNALRIWISKIKLIGKTPIEIFSIPPLHFMTSNRSGLVLVYSISICRIRHCYLRIVFVVNANFPMSTSSAASTAFVACGGISDRTEQLCNGNQEKLIMKFAL